MTRRSRRTRGTRRRWRTRGRRTRRDVRRRRHGRRSCRRADAASKSPHECAVCGPIRPLAIIAGCQYAPDMAKLGWTASVGLAVGASAGMAAAQFGLGYGLGIISWAPATTGGTPDETWLASLAWTVFIAATSTVTGTIIADR